MELKRKGNFNPVTRQSFVYHIVVDVVMILHISFCKYACITMYQVLDLNTVNVCDVTTCRGLTFNLEVVDICTIHTLQVVRQF